MLYTPTVIVLAYLMDKLIGDPKNIPHPVIFIGKAISFLENPVRRMFPANLKLGGFLFPVFIIGGTYVVAFTVIELLALLHPIAKWVGEAWLISTTIAIKGLKQAGMEIFHHLKNGELKQARFSLSKVVGRDTDSLSTGEVARGGIETVAENIVDAVTAPLFFAMIGGAPLALAYRATNTLDSMIGYKNEKYKDLGFASAKLDDLLNFTPARITVICLLLSFFIMRLPVISSFQIVLRDARLHPSPNSGIPEAAVAGALGIQLGGRNEYNGIPSLRAKMGEPLHPIQADHILKTIKILDYTSFLFVFIYSIIAYFLFYGGIK
jgi:adenosylcobinamide-phosphate synthase